MFLGEETQELEKKQHRGTGNSWQNCFRGMIGSVVCQGGKQRILPPSQLIQGTVMKMGLRHGPHQCQGQFWTRRCILLGRTRMPWPFLSIRETIQPKTRRVFPLLLYICVAMVASF